MLTITVERVDDRAVLRLDGDLALETVDQLVDTVRQLTPLPGSVEVDCLGLRFVDSTGVNALLQAVLGWKQKGASVSLVRLGEEIREMLDLLGFFEVLEEPE
jgi:anti-anti-sigma factor